MLQYEGEVGMLYGRRSCISINTESAMVEIVLYGGWWHHPQPPAHHQPPTPITTQTVITMSPQAKIQYTDNPIFVN